VVRIAGVVVRGRELEREPGAVVIEPGQTLRAVAEFEQVGIGARELVRLDRSLDL